MIISSTDPQQLLQYIKDDSKLIGAYTKVKFKHEKKTKNKEIETTFGRVVFNSFLPEDYPFINEPVNRKKLKSILVDILNKYGKEEYDKTVYKIQKYGLIFGTYVPATIELSKLELPEEIIEMKKELMKNAENMSSVEFNKYVDEIYNKLEKYLSDSTMFDMIKSGTKGKKSDIEQLLIAWGTAFDPTSDMNLVVKHSLLEGMTPEELYYGANKARLAAYLKSTYSAQPGYLARKMRIALNNVKLSSIEDCKTKKFFEIKVNNSIKNIIKGRYYLDEKSGELEVIDDNNIDELVDKVIKMRSPLYCKAKDGICKTCYGKLSEQINNESIGLTTSGSIYVRTLNKFMKISHGKMTAEEEVDFEKEIKNFFSE